jgi:RHS repeat-associated protein
MYAGSSSNSCSSAPTGAVTYSFDANGNETGSSTGASLTYNPQNQATAITYGGATLSPLTYSGTGQGMRTAAGPTALDNGSSGVQISTTGGSSTYYLRDGRGNLIGERIGSSHYYYLKDGSGSIVAVIGGDGLTVGDRYGYDPYGNTTYRSGSTPNVWGFAGGYTDPTGLVKFGARYYDPLTARWTQLDPATQGRPSGACGCSAYAYANDNPTNNGDPSGLWWYSWHWWGIFLDLNYWETLSLVWYGYTAATALGIAGALATVGASVILGLILAWDATTLWILDSWHSSGVWIKIFWFTGGWMQVGCNGCSWGWWIWV